MNQNKRASLTYFGHATTMITTESAKKVMLDPWLEGNPLCPKELQDPAAVDFIVLTHGHFDHTASAVALAQRTNAVVCGVFELMNLLVKDGLSDQRIQPMGKGGTVALGGGLEVSLTNAFHSSSYNAKDGQTYYAGEPCGAVITLESGRSIYHAGDTCLFADMQLIREQFRPEVALLPIGDRFTMGPKQAARAVEFLQPKIVVPVHYGTFPLLSGTVEEFASLVPKQILRALKPGQSVEL